MLSNNLISGAGTGTLLMLHTSSSHSRIRSFLQPSELVQQRKKCHRKQFSCQLFSWICCFYFLSRRNYEQNWGRGGRCSEFMVAEWSYFAAAASPPYQWRKKQTRKMPTLTEKMNSNCDGALNSGNGREHDKRACIWDSSGQAMSHTAQTELVQKSHLFRFHGPIDFDDSAIVHINTDTMKEMFMHRAIR